MISGGNNRGYKTLGANRDVLEEGEALYITKLCIFLAKCASWKSTRLDKLSAKL
jgi:hypothetical protein